MTVETECGAASTIATNTHPFWEADEKKWVDAGDLRPGAQLRSVEGEALRVTEVRHFVKQQRTHDLTVSGVHTYQFFRISRRSRYVRNRRTSPSRANAYWRG
ncbi:polymorphic toxin-type HINT domain-containing protein [Streptomyces sp. NPDC053048]|uniref:polymorphic toxin-type HINT domain-containing protein n=1 Tax=Streptomyces sp. NPDC053048 TaxID=3365694 RepID=UPI0037D04E73